MAAGKWTQDEVDRLAKLAAEGYTAKQIARTLGRGWAAVRFKAQAERISLGRNPAPKKPGPKPKPIPPPTRQPVDAGDRAERAGVEQPKETLPPGQMPTKLHARRGLWAVARDPSAPHGTRINALKAYAGLTEDEGKAEAGLPEDLLRLWDDEAERGMLQDLMDELRGRSKAPKAEVAKAEVAT